MGAVLIKQLNENINIPHQSLWDTVLKGEFIVLNVAYENVSIIKIPIEQYMLSILRNKKSKGRAQEKKTPFE